MWFIVDVFIVDVFSVDVFSVDVRIDVVQFITAGRDP